MTAYFLKAADLFAFIQERTAPCKHSHFYQKRSLLHKYTVHCVDERKEH